MLFLMDASPKSRRRSGRRCDLRAHQCRSVFHQIFRWKSSIVGWAVLTIICEGDRPAEQRGIRIVWRRIRISTRAVSRDYCRVGRAHLCMHGDRSIGLRGPKIARPHSSNSARGITDEGILVGTAHRTNALIHSAGSSGGGYYGFQIADSRSWVMRFPDRTQPRNGHGGHGPPYGLQGHAAQHGPPKPIQQPHVP